ncbi:hypothetical protein [Streptomyces sp. NBC_00233]|uniref:hypothetical protein n=1 Tax=Streptomyces sp. NBC_00233 TaxID=2975686 RepID=UPI00224C8328|nr:hypothetical protein [Streptomyces sp. NBC_00233]MCX5233061.1 hypothetical protein [Streptomyces sp. NBC_00233]
MKLADQLAALAEIGLALAPGRSIAELLHSRPRGEYERRPYDALLFTLGIEVEAEPWGRWFCDRAWTFDTECVHGPGAYVEIARQLCRLVGRPDALVDVRDHVELDVQTGTGRAWIEFTVDGRRSHWDIAVEDDWADMSVVTGLMAELERDGRKFHAMDNGQAMVLFYLDPAAARTVNELAGGERLAALLPE